MRKKPMDYALWCMVIVFIGLLLGSIDPKGVIK